MDSKPDSIPSLDSRTGETIERTLQETCDSVLFHCPCTPITFILECFQLHHMEQDKCHDQHTA